MSAFAHRGQVIVAVPTAAPWINVRLSINALLVMCFLSSIPHMLHRVESRQFTPAQRSYQTIVAVCLSSSRIPFGQTAVKGTLD